MTEAVRACGAKTKGGGTCRSRPFRPRDGREPNGRCRLHGGNNPGGKPGNTNAVKHGIYSEVLSAEDRQAWERVEIGSIDDEIRIARIRLRRALQEQVKQEALAEIHSAAELKEKLQVSEIKTVSIPSNGQGGPTTQTEVKRVRRDYSKQINGLIRLVADLEAKKLLMQGNNPGSADEVASKIKAALRAMDEVNGMASTVADGPG